MLYADDAEVVSQFPEKLRKLMGVLVVVCTTVDLTVSGAKTETTPLRTNEVPESTAIFNQTNEFVYLGRNVNHSANLLTEVDRRIRTA